MVLLFDVLIGGDYTPLYPLSRTKTMVFHLIQPPLIVEPLGSNFINGRFRVNPFLDDEFSRSLPVMVDNLVGCLRIKTQSVFPPVSWPA